MILPAIGERDGLEARLKLEVLLADLSSRFTGLAPGEVDREILDAQHRICDALGLDVCALWQWLPEQKGFLTLTHYFRRFEGPAVPSSMNASDYFPWLLKELMAGKVVAFSSTEEFPAEAARDRESVEYFGIKSLVNFPLWVGTGPPFGLVSFHSMLEKHTWPIELVDRLRLAANVFANALGQKRSIEVLRESEARLTLAADSAEAGLWVLDWSASAFWATDRARAIFGFGPEEAITVERFEASVVPEDREIVHKTIEGARHQCDPVRIQYRILRNDGCVRWIDSRGRPSFLADGEPGRLTGVSIDITESKQAEDALRQSYEEIKRLKDRLQAESDYLKAEINQTYRHDQIIGQSAAIRQVLRQVEQVAPTDSSVLICGETGTGKELIAQAIHRLGPRRDHVFIKVNCAALPSGLVESELFGREKGAFTGALTRQVGRFEIADGSTIFLDEIGELPLEVQSKLLNVLQEGQFERLGSPRTIRINVRVIAATNRELTEELQKGRFREDLYYRLNVFPIRVPALRERAEDIPLMVWAFLDEFCSRMGKKITQVSRKTMEMLQRNPWPGNVRQLRNVIEHGVIITPGHTLMVPMLDDAATADGMATQSLADNEREHILKTLEKTTWRIKGPKGAAALLGLKPSTLYTRMEKLGIPNRRQKEYGA
jgi:PAS domain S-box-containing protein